MQLYHHKTDGGAEYLTDTYILCDNGHKEGNMNSDTQYLIRIDGDITKDAELTVRDVPVTISEIIQELNTIKQGIESDNYTMDNIDNLINKLKR